MFKVANTLINRLKMQDREKTKEQLISEIDQLKSKIGKYEKSETEQTITEKTMDLVGENLNINDLHLHKLIKSIPDLIWLKDINGVYLSCNRRFENFFGTPMSEILGKTDYDFIDKELADFFHEGDMKAITDGESRIEEDEVVFVSDGHSEILETIKTPISNSDGKIVGVLGIAREITKRKQTEKELQKSEKKYKDLFEKSKDAILIIHNGKFVDCNQTTVNMLHYVDKEEFLNTHPSELSPEIQSDGQNSIEKADQMMELAFKRGSHRFEWDHKKADGKIFPVEVVLTVIENQENQKILHTVWRDISERKKAEIELRQSEERFKRLFEDLGNAVFVTKIGGAEKGMILEVNPAAEQQTGYSRKELLQLNIIHDIFVPGSGEISTEDWDALLKSGKPVTTIEKKRRKDGTEFWTEVIVTPIEFKGEQASLSINHDITKQRQSEKALKESEEHFRAMFENTSIGFYRTTPGGKIEYANPALISMLGFKNFDELRQHDLEKQSFDVVTPRSKILDLINRDGYLKGYESVWKVNDNKDIFIRENATAYFDQEGEVMYYEGTIEDITDSKRAELLLKESEEKYRILIENIQEGVFLLDDGKLIFANDAFAAIVGYTNEEVLGQNFQKFIAPEDVKMIKEYYAKGMKGDPGSVEYEFCALHKNGNRRVFVNIVVDTINYEGKKVVLGTVKDISETKRIQEELALREKYYRTLFDLSPSGIVVINKNGIILDVNNSFCTNTGYTSDELNNANLNMLVPKERHQKMNKHIRKIMNGETLRQEVINISKDGSIRNVELNETKVLLPDGQTGILSIANDITERTRAAKIQSVIYKISYAVNLTDNLDELISIIRQSLGKLIDTTNFFVATYDEVTDTIKLPYIVDEKDSHSSFPAGKTLTAYVIKTKKPLLATREVLAALESSGEIETVGTGSEIWLGVPLIVKGRATGAIVVQSYTDEHAYGFQDLEMLEFVSHAISVSIERKKTEQELLNALEKATESDKLKSTFLATMSHELRTPLNAIIGFSEIIDQDLSIDDILEFNKTINNSGIHLLNIVEDIFDISLIEAGQIKIAKKEEKLHEILDEIDEIVRAEQKRTGKSNLDLKLIIPPESIDLLIFTDASKLKQILINLLKNALKFTNEGHVHFGYQIVRNQNKKILKFYVEDTGIGIPADKLEIIFDIFRQVEDSNTRIYGGTGIGLSISKKIASLFDGDIWVESELGKGSKFYFTLPDSIIETTPYVENGASDKGINYARKTILIAEDDEASYALLEISLRKMSVKIIWAKDGKEAVDLCKNNSPDLILMDINMPEMDGYEATRQIRKFIPDIPIIAQTAFAMVGDRELAIKAGCDDYISKPIKKEELMQLIDLYINKLRG